MKRYEGGAFHVFETGLAHVANELEFAQRIALCIGKGCSKESLANAILLDTKVCSTAISVNSIFFYLRELQLARPQQPTYHPKGEGLFLKGRQ